MHVVGREDQLEASTRRALRADRLALDLEASGMFAYRARICVAQLAWEDEVVLIDTLAVPVPALRQLLGPEGPVKIVHDVGFDARLLAEEGVDLGTCTTRPWRRACSAGPPPGWPRCSIRSSACASERS